jgi:hypothetical protein
MASAGWLRGSGGGADVADPRMLAQALMTGQTVDPYTQPYGRERERQSEIARTLMGLKRLPQDMVAGAPVVGDIASGVAQWAQDNPLDAGALAVSPVPVVGDIAGLANDVRHYVNDPESRTWTNFGLSALGTLPFVPPVMATFAGIGAKTADFGALSKAKELTAAGRPREDIWRETGWFQGVDGNWRFEIDDSTAQLTGAKEGKLRDVMTHPDLYNAYPEVGDITVIRDPDPSYLGSYDATNKIMTYNPDVGSERVLSTLIHEGNHGVQDVAGHAPGGNPFMFEVADNTKIVAAKRRMDEIDSHISGINAKISEMTSGDNVFREPGGAKAGIGTRLGRAVGLLPEAWELNRAKIADLRAERNALENVYKTEIRNLGGAIKDAPRRSYDEMFDMYRSLAGEAEARAAQARLRMTAPERTATFPTYDVPENEQIVRFRNRDIANALMQSGGRP